MVIEVAASEPAQTAATPEGRTVAARVRTVEEAVAAARRIRRAATSDVSIAIELAAGRHRLTGPVRLGPEDSGTWGAPLVIRPVPGGGRVEITGALPLAPLGPLAGHRRAGEVAAILRSEVRRYRLPPTLAAAPSIERARFHAVPAVPLAFEIFDASGALSPARWPNAGHTRTAATNTATRALAFTPTTAPDADRLAGWVQERDLWLVGHPRYDWSYETLAIGIVDANVGRLTLATPPRYGLADGRRVAVMHALAELDRPGEWYRDIASGEILLLPRPGASGAAIEASIAESAFVFAGASHVQIADITITRFRGDAVVVEGGVAISLERVAVSWTAGRAVVMRGAQASGVTGALIHDTGEGGVVLEGGDRATLAPSRQVVADSRFMRFSRLGRSYKPAIAIAGVGARVVGNIVTDGPHMGLMIAGNDHEIAENIFARLVTDADDAGAIYIGRDWTARGTVIRANVLCDIRAAPGFDVKGIYLDDFASGITVEGNVFLRVDQPLFIGGGRDNVVTRNVFVTASPAVHVDARGLTWAQASIDDPASELRKALAGMPVSSPAWRKRYPSLAGLLEAAPHLPSGNRIVANLVVGGVAMRLQGVPDGVVTPGPQHTADIPIEAQGSRDPEALERALAPALATARLADSAAAWSSAAARAACNAH